jgi:hypothetical protein
MARARGNSLANVHKHSGSKEHKWRLQKCLSDQDFDVSVNVWRRILLGPSITDLNGRKTNITAFYAGLRYLIR